MTGGRRDRPTARQEVVSCYRVPGNNRTGGQRDREAARQAYSVTGRQCESFPSEERFKRDSETACQGERDMGSASQGGRQLDREMA